MHHMFRPPHRTLLQLTHDIPSHPIPHAQGRPFSEESRHGFQDANGHAPAAERGLNGAGAPRVADPPALPGGPAVRGRGMIGGCLIDEGGQWKLCLHPMRAYAHTRWIDSSTGHRMHNVKHSSSSSSRRASSSSTTSLPARSCSPWSRTSRRRWDRARLREDASSTVTA